MSRPHLLSETVATRRPACCPFLDSFRKKGQDSRPARVISPWEKLGGPWAFYDDFWTAQGMKQLRDWIEPRLGVRLGGSVAIPLTLTNNTPVDQDITLISRVPSDWIEATRSSRFRVRAHDICATEIIVTAPAKTTASSALLTWEASMDRHSVGSVTVRAYPGYSYLPQ